MPLNASLRTHTSTFEHFLSQALGDNGEQGRHDFNHVELL